MALKIWLPLVKDINNNGTEISNFISTGAAVSSSGPLGNSFSFNGSSNQIYGSYTCQEEAFTVCMWVTFTKLGVHLLDMRNSDGVGYQPMYVGTSGIQVGGSGDSYVYINFVPSLNTWYHLCIVANSTNTSLYVNGEYYDSASPKAHNFNRKIDIHIGSRYSGAFWFGGNVADFRLYNEALSPYEIKKIAQGLLLHYTTPFKAMTAGNTVNDSSGFERNGTVMLNNLNMSHGSAYNWGRYYNAFDVASTSSDQSYITLTSPSASTTTVSFWIKTPKTATTVFFADYKSKLGFGFNSSGYIIVSCVDYNVKMYTDTSAINTSNYNHIVLRKTSSDVELFINGVKQTTRGSTNYWSHSTNTLMIGRRSSGTPMNSSFSDFRMYCTALSDADILELYNTTLKQFSNGKSATYELKEDTLGKVNINRQGVLTNDEFIESNTGSKFSSTSVTSNEFIEI